MTPRAPDRADKLAARSVPLPEHVAASANSEIGGEAGSLPALKWGCPRAAFQGAFAYGQGCYGTPRNAGGTGSIQVGLFPTLKGHIRRVYSVRPADDTVPLTTDLPADLSGWPRTAPLGPLAVKRAVKLPRLVTVISPSASPRRGAGFFSRPQTGAMTMEYQQPGQLGRAFVAQHQAYPAQGQNAAHPAEATHLERLMNEINQLSTEVANLCGCLATTANKLTGEVPTPDCKQTGPQVHAIGPGGMLGEAFSRVESIADYVNQAAAHLARIQRAV